MTAHLDPQLNDADLELLSAYIDSQLASDERAILEQRLRDEPDLRAVLDELRATVGLLHELEPLKPPRSFTLDIPATRPRRAWVFPWAGVGSALVAMLCVAAFSFVLLNGTRQNNAPAAAIVMTAAP